VSAHSLNTCPLKAQALAASLEFYAALTHLLLPCNHIGFVGAAALLEHSARCSTLTSLDLSSNVLGRMRPARLFPALHSSAVRSSVVRSQHSASDGFEAMHAAAARCSRLASLNLACNYITEPEMHRLHDAWGPRAGLTCLPAPSSTEAERALSA
jgi:hypothetical protein